jgi:hypothetical protein
LTTKPTLSYTYPLPKIINFTDAPIPPIMTGRFEAESVFIVYFNRFRSIGEILQTVKASMCLAFESWLSILVQPAMAALSPKARPSSGRSFRLNAQKLLNIQGVPSMILENKNILAGLALMAIANLGIAQPSLALPGQSLSQNSSPSAPAEMTEPSLSEPEMPDSEMEAAETDASGVTEVKATVVRVTNNNAVRVKMPDGSYEMISLLRSTRLSSLAPGAEIYVSMRGDEIIGVSSEAGAYRQQIATRQTTTTTSSSVESRQSIQQEAQIQPAPRPQVTPQVTPAPAPAPAPAPEPTVRPAEPVRALW